MPYYPGLKRETSQLQTSLFFLLLLFLPTFQTTLINNFIATTTQTNHTSNSNVYGTSNFYLQLLPLTSSSINIKSNCSSKASIVNIAQVSIGHSVYIKYFGIHLPSSSPTSLLLLWFTDRCIHTVGWVRIAGCRGGCWLGDLRRLHPTSDTKCNGHESVND